MLIDRLVGNVDGVAPIDTKAVGGLTGTVKSGYIGEGCKDNLPVGGHLSLGSTMANQSQREVLSDVANPVIRMEERVVLASNTRFYDHLKYHS